MRATFISKLAIGLFVAMTCFAKPALAQTTFGMPDCGEWTKLSKDRPADRAWLLGFISGLNVFYNLNGRPDDPLAKINSNLQIYAWMDNFCQKNPLSTTGLGGLDLHRELIKK